MRSSKSFRSCLASLNIFRIVFRSDSTLALYVKLQKPSLRASLASTGNTPNANENKKLTLALLLLGFLGNLRGCTLDPFLLIHNCFCNQSFNVYFRFNCLQFSIKESPWCRHHFNTAVKIELVNYS